MRFISQDQKSGFFLSTFTYTHIKSTIDFGCVFFPLSAATQRSNSHKKTQLLIFTKLTEPYLTLLYSAMTANLGYSCCCCCCCDGGGVGGSSCVSVVVVVVIDHDEVIILVGLFVLY